MNTHSAVSPGSDYFYVPHPVEPLEQPNGKPKTSWAGRLVPCVAFFVMVFASMAAAATVISEAPLILVGLY
ncbi:MAG: hypothetical protein V4573_18290 [Pseudomonadota bacterium]